MDLVIRKPGKRKGDEERVLRVRLHRNVPSGVDVELKDYFEDVPLNKIRRFISRDRNFDFLYRIAKKREMRGLASGLNFAAALEHSVSAMRLGEGSNKDLLKQVLKQPTAKRIFVRSLLRYADEKTYSRGCLHWTKSWRSMFQAGFLSPTWAVPTATPRKTLRTLFLKREWWGSRLLSRLALR